MTIPPVHPFKIGASLVLGQLLASSAFAATNMAPPSLALPTPAQIVWQDCEIGLLFDFELAPAAGDFTPNNASRKRFDPNLYQPDKLNTDEWATLCKASGANYAVFTATHFNGFMQWQSDAYPYGLKQTSWRGGKGDVVADFVTSCRRVDVKPGIFFSVHRNVYQEVWGHYVNWGKGKGTPEQEAYNRIAEKQMEEICSKYGPLVQIWFDAGAKTPGQGGADLLPIFEKYQPSSVFYSSGDRSDHRWVGNEEGHAGSPCYATMPGKGSSDGLIGHANKSWGRYLHGGDPDGTVWSPAMVDIPLRGKGGHNWFYKPGQDHMVYTPQDLMRMYDTSVGRNANLIIGVVIKPDGSIPEADVKALTEFGKLLKARFANPVAQLKDAEGATVTLDLAKPQEINTVILQEQIKFGERVRDHVVEGCVNGDWVVLAQGKVIGHKWIYCFKPQTVSAVRLRVTRTLAPPKIRSFSCFLTDAGKMPPKTPPVTQAKKTEAPPPLTESGFCKSLAYHGIAVQEKGWHIWGCSPIAGKDGKIHLFAERWPTSVPFDTGWRQYAQIAHYVGDTPEGPFTFSDVALSATGTNTWDKYAPCNSHIQEIDGKYVLLYIANSNGMTRGIAAHTASQRIGMAVADTLNGPWKRVGADGLILSPSEDPKHWTYRAGNGVNNPAIMKHPDGRYLLYYKSSRAQMGVALADKLEGPYVHQPEPFTKNKTAIEDGYAFATGGKYYFLTTDNHGIGVRGGGLLWASPDGIHFDAIPKIGFKAPRDCLPKTDPNLIHNFYGAGTFQRPQVLMQRGKPAYLYVASGTTIANNDGSICYVFKCN